MNILHVVKDFSTPSQTFIYNLVAALEECGSTKNTVGFYRTRLLEQERPFPRTVFIGAGKDWMGRARRAVKFKTKELEQAQNIHRIIIQEEPEVIHCHFAWSLWDCLWNYCRYFELKTPVLVSVHGTDILRSLAKSPETARKIIEMSKTHALHFVAANPFMANASESAGIPKNLISIIPNAVDARLFNTKTPPSSDPSRFKIVSNGRFVGWKGHVFLIEAFARFVKEVCPHAQLNLIGTGECGGDLKMRVKQLGISESVVFLGRMPHTDVLETLQCQDLYIQPSIRDPETGQCEAFGIAVLEAMCTGLPVIVTNTGGMPNLVACDSSHNIIVPEQDSNALFEAMKTIYSLPPEEKMDHAYARETAKRYSLGQQVESYLATYRKLLSARTN